MSIYPTTTAGYEFRSNTTDPLDLLVQDYGQRNNIDVAAQQPEFILDCGDQSIRFDTRQNHENAVTVYQWHGHEQAFSLPVLVDAAALSTEIMAGEYDALITRIIAGYESVWNGSNHVARYTDDAQQATEELRVALEDAPTLRGENAGLWSALDWFEQSSDSDLGITAATTDKELRAIAASHDADARAEHIVLAGTEEVLTDRRDALREEVAA